MPLKIILALLVAALVAGGLVCVAQRLKIRGANRQVRLVVLSLAAVILASALLVGSLMTLVGGWLNATTISDHSGKPLSVEEARQSGCPIPLPDEARHVQFATACGGLIACQMLIRFEAPSEVCRRQVQVVNDAKRAGGSGPSRALFVPLARRAPPMDHDMLGRAAWFDIENIQHGLAVDYSPAGNCRFWIDQDRGIFYCEITD